MKTDGLKLDLHSQPCKVAYRYREGSRTAIVVLHGFGSIKEDYDPLYDRTALRDHAILTYDAPGHGKSRVDAPEKLVVEDNLEAVKGLLRYLDIKEAHLVYHSMGGIPALMLASENPELVASLTCIEGNLAPEDCIYSRKVLDFDPVDDKKFFEMFRADLAASTSPAEPEYGAALVGRVSAEATGAYFRSIVKHTDNGSLLETFLNLKLPRHFIHGDENRGLSYIDDLRKNGVTVSEIIGSGHLPMYANPEALWQYLETFIEQKT